MTRAKFLRDSAAMLGLAIVAGPLLPGCSEEGPDPTKAENAPASKAKDSMDYYRSKKKGKTK